MENKKAKIADIVFPRGGGSKDEIKISSLELKKAVNVLRALNHKLRHQIMKLIDDHKNTTVTEIYTKLKIEQSVASQHLAILRDSKVVTTQRDGKFIHYSVNKDRLVEISKLVKLLAE
jgi:DNA-binding transcriptional ArsR family regulator